MSEYILSDILRIMRDEATDGVVTLHNIKKHFNLKSPAAVQRFDTQMGGLVAANLYVPIDGNKGYVR